MCQLCTRDKFFMNFINERSEIAGPCLQQTQKIVKEVLVLANYQLSPVLIMTQNVGQRWYFVAEECGYIIYVAI